MATDVDFANLFAFNLQMEVLEVPNHLLLELVEDREELELGLVE
jgi:hypothetical protein